MTNQLRYLLFGSVIALVVLCVGFFMNQYLSGEVESLVAQCKVEHKKAQADAPAWAKDPLVCEVQALASQSPSSGSQLVGIQARIVERHEQAHVWLLRSRLLAAFIFVALALPYSWYFLLRRIAELREAIAGR